MKLIKILSVNIGILIALFFLGELTFRLQHLMRYGTMDARTLTSHERRGWTTRPNFSLGYLSTDVSGNPYQIQYSTEKNGFREFGDISSSKKKLLVIGDSFTHARHASTGKLYFNHIDTLEFEVFAFGSSGYGNYQEYLILKNWVEKIKPDYILWQLCINDISDNHYELDKKVGFSGITFPRPYYSNTQVSFPKYKPGYLTIIQHSLFFDYFYSKFLISMGIQEGPIIDIEINREKAKSYILGAKVVNQIFTQARLLIPSTTKVFTFLVNGNETYEKLYEEASLNVGFNYLKGLPAWLKKYQDIWAEDGGHWNEKGHRITGRYLDKLIREKLDKKEE